MNNQIQNDEIDLADLFKTIMKYKYIIALFAIIFTLGAAVFAYTKPSVYSSFATIELQEDTKSFNADDALKQIEDKGYDKELRSEGYKNIIRYGSFQGI
jgi:uncharacterized protein involved in exopolysaccharide biosynthesis